MTTTQAKNARGENGKLSLAEILELMAAGDLPLRFSAYDGSTAGPENAELGLDLLTPRGTTYLATAPGDLGLARAYVSGDIEMQGVHPGDPYELLKAMAERLDFKRPPARVLANIVRSIGLEHLRPIARRHRRPCPVGGGWSRASGTAKRAIPKPSTTIMMSQTRSTSGCLARR